MAGTDCAITREGDEERVVFRLAGVFDRASAWMLREKLDREEAREVLLDFSDVHEFSDLGVAVLAHGVTGASRLVLFRGLRQHQLRIFRYCGVAVDEASAREAEAEAGPASERAHASPGAEERP